MASEDELPHAARGLEALEPPVQRVSEVGWSTFLREWDKRASSMIHETDMRYGLSFTPTDAKFFKKTLHDAQVTGLDETFTPSPAASKDKVFEAKAHQRAVLLQEASRRITALLGPSSIQEMNWEFWSGKQSMFSSPASKAAIIKLEKRLNCPLPPSYRSFLERSNGWLMSTPLAATEEVAWLRDKKLDLVRTLSCKPTTPGAKRYTEEEYLSYGRNLKVISFLPEYGNDLLLIIRDADWSECDILLNPKVMTAQGEWEAGYSGEGRIARFSSFAHLMEWQYLCEIAELGVFHRLRAKAFAD